MMRLEGSGLDQGGQLPRGVWVPCNNTGLAADTCAGELNLLDSKLCVATVSLTTTRLATAVNTQSSKHPLVAAAGVPVVAHQVT